MLTVPCLQVPTSALTALHLATCSTCATPIKLAPQYAVGISSGTPIRTLCPGCWEREQKRYATKLAARKGHLVEVWEPCHAGTAALGICVNCKDRGELGSLDHATITLEGSLFEDRCRGRQQDRVLNERDRAFREGQEARVAGLGAQANPYGAHSTRAQSCRGAWLEGFRADTYDLRELLESRGVALYGAERWETAVKLFVDALKAAECDVNRRDVKSGILLAAHRHLEVVV